MDSDTLPSMTLSDDESACLQDFETTLQSYVTPEQLLGVLNFNTLWNPVTYVYDTAIGDSPHIIDSFLAPVDSERRALYTSIRALIEAGALRVLIRKVVQVNGKTLFESPRISQIYEGWRVRDKDSNAKFLAQRFGDERATYNRVMDRLLDESYAIKYYQPDIAKSEFRSIVRNRLDTEDDFRALVFKLPVEVRQQFLRTCSDNQFMTTVDLWRLVNPLSPSNLAARKLTVALGFINQQAIAHSVSAGVSGSDTGHGYRPMLRMSEPPRLLNPGELLGQADLALDVPALKLIGQLSPTDIVALRKIAGRTIFRLPATPDTSAPQVRSALAAAMREYWGEVCAYVDAHYPDQSRRKVKIYAYIDRNIPTFKRWYRRSGPFRDIVEVATTLLLKQDTSGTSSVLRNLIKRVAVTILYTKSDEFRSLEALESRLWTPQAAWSNQDETNRNSDA